MTGINGGDVLTVGFGHHTVMSVADKVIGSVLKQELSSTSS